MQGIFFALLAAICNSLIGVFSSVLISQGLSSEEIAFWRCLIAFILIALFYLYKYELTNLLMVNKKEILRYIILAFFGLNVMYLGETMAISYINIALVSFLLYSSGILTIILSFIYFKEQITIIKICCIISVFLGISIIFMNNIVFNGNIIGLFLATSAGIGYSLYIFLNKKWKIMSDLKTLCYLFLFGSIFLGISLLLNNIQLSLSIYNLPYILLLVFVPTIGGFYCTNKAINMTKISNVQLVEMSEPFIVTILGVLCLKQMPTIYEFIGGIFISLGLIFIIKNEV